MSSAISLLDLPPAINASSSSPPPSRARLRRTLTTPTEAAAANMVIATVTAAAAAAAAQGNERVQARPLPVLDLSTLPRGRGRAKAAEVLVRACEELGFFKVVNHGVPRGAVARMEAESSRFFALPSGEKLTAGPPTPLGYGIRSIGFHGDMGELEYLLLHSNPAYISHKAKSICRKDPSHFSGVVNEYVKQVRKLACELLDLLGEGLGLEDSGVFSSLLKDTDNDSLLRLNHYPCPPPPPPPPPCFPGSVVVDHHHHHHHHPAASPIIKSVGGGGGGDRIGFGEHSDPQLLSVLRSNDVDGLQIRLPGETCTVWVPVPSDPTAFYVSVGDALQAMTNGRLTSVRHRAMANSSRSRMSTIFFAAPSLSTTICPLPEMVQPPLPRRYRPFTWGEYKKAMYSLRLGHNRLDLFLEDQQPDHKHDDDDDDSH